MDFKSLVINILATILLIVQRFVLLAHKPYKTMRTIAQESDYTQLVILGSIILVYFYLSEILRPTGVLFLIKWFVFIVNYVVTVGFFLMLASLYGKKGNVASLAVTFGYSLLPTMLWFLTNSALFYILPPPRTESSLGLLFSLFFISFSIGMLLWKIMLVYLSLRFSTHLPFVKIMIMIALYAMFLIPYSVFLYMFDIFRIPFI